MDLTTVLLLLCFFAVLVLLLRKSNRQNSRPCPPGPSWFSLMRNIVLIRHDYIRFKQFVPYGPVSGSMLSKKGPAVVVLNSYEAVQEAFVGQADIFSGRPKIPYMDMMTRKSGIIFVDGPLWQEHRRFTLRLLRDFGIGRSGAETIVGEECSAIKERLEDAASHQEGVDCRSFFTAAINNVIARFTFGERCGTEDPKFQAFTRDLDESLALKKVDLVPFMFPIIVKIPPLLWIVERWSQWRRLAEKMHDYIREKIEQHEQQLKAEDMWNIEPTNLCDAYLIEKYRQEAQNPGQHTFTEWQLIRNMIELFLGGTETTSTSLTWAALMLSLYPEVQKKAQRDVLETIGRDRAPQMSDRLTSPYLCALMDEVLRYSSLIATNVMHRNVTETELLGYFIPANSMIQVNFYHIHHDPEIWERPEEFYPKHFLTPEGNYKPSKYLMAFSVGKRACLGESLARMELFLMLATILQNFEMKLEDPQADVEAILKGKIGALRIPLAHNIVFSKLSD